MLIHELPQTVRQQLVEVSDDLNWQEFIEGAEKFFDREGNLKVNSSAINHAN